MVQGFRSGNGIKLNNISIIIIYDIIIYFKMEFGIISQPH